MKETSRSEKSLEFNGTIEKNHKLTKCNNNNKTDEHKQDESLT